MLQVTLPPGKHKIIVLDEADSMTSAAQQGVTIKRAWEQM
jgi:replication factor C subunit 2/4